MKKIRHSVLLTLLMSSSVYGAEDMKAIEVVSIATKTAKSIDGIAASIEVVTREDIDKIGGKSLKDIINRVPGVWMQHSGGPGSSGQAKSAISIRGINAKGTLVLIDGRRVATEFKKAYDLNRIPASQIERIEIIKGPMSTLYGSDAAGGVVNIITRKPKDGKTDINFGIQYGQNADGEGQKNDISLVLKSSIDKFKYSVYGNYATTKPYIQREDTNVYIAAKKPSDMKKPSQNPKTQGKVQDIYYDEDITFRDDSEIFTYGARVDYQIMNNTVIGAEFNAFNEKREGTYFAAFSKSNYKNNQNKPIKLTNLPINTKENNKRLDVGLDIVSHINDDLTLTLRGYQSKYKKFSTATSEKWEDLGFANEKATKATKMEIEIDIKTIEAMLNYALNESHLLTGGVEQRKEERDSFVFPDGIQKVEHKSVYLQDEWEIQDTLNVIAGFRYDDISDVENKTTFKFGIIKNFSDLLNVRANFAQGYRAPDTKELYVYRTTSKGTQRGALTVDANLGKPSYDLKPEFTNAYELGLSGRNGKISYSTALFLNYIDNQIASVKKDKYFTYENIAKAETKGIEASLNYEILDNLYSGFSWVELRTKNKSNGKNLAFQPERMLSVNLDYQINNDFSMGVFIKHTGKQSFTEIINSGTPQESKRDAVIDSYNSVDTISSYHINKNLKVYGGVDNLFNADVDDAIGSTVGRYFYVGLEVKL
ncbi:MAG: TonB-dependent receptor [Sulfurimonas sp.]|nr:TonB-dependent receptor [Sulfurimonas sp.]